MQKRPYYDRFVFSGELGFKEEDGKTFEQSNFFKFPKIGGELGFSIKNSNGIMFPAFRANADLENNFDLNFFDKSTKKQVEFLEFARTELEQYKGKKVVVTGNIEYQHSANAGKIYQKFAVQNIREFDAEKDKETFVLNQLLTFAPDCLEENEDGKGFNIQCYRFGNLPTGVVGTNGKNEYKPQFFPYLIKLNGEKLNFENEKHKRHYDYLKNFFNVKEISWCPIQLSYFNGNAEIELQFEDLTEAQQTQIELGISTLKDFQKTVRGGRIEEIRLIKPLLKGEFGDGMLSLDISEDDFDEQMFRGATSTTSQTTKTQNDNSEISSELDALDDLLG